MIHDITPVKNFIQRAYASLSYSLAGISIRKKKIDVKYIPSSEAVEVFNELDYSEGDYMPSMDDWR